VIETDLLEKSTSEIETSDNRVSVSLDPFEIKTLKVVRKEKG
jgi:alpha-mannosidase